MLEFLGFLIFTLTPIYFFSGNLTQHSISQTNFVVVRLRRKKNWLAIIQASFVITVLLYFFAFFFTLSVSSILLGRFTLEAEKATALLRRVVPMIDITASIFKAMALRSLELCCVQEVLLLIYACVCNGKTISILLQSFAQNIPPDLPPPRALRKTSLHNGGCSDCLRN